MINHRLNCLFIAADCGGRAWLMINSLYEFAQTFCGRIFSLPGPTGRQTEQNQNELCGNNLKRTVLICAKKTKLELDFKSDIYLSFDLYHPAQ